jgi:hypothetical protein
VKFLLPLLFITILAIIISSGCGGGGGVTQQSTLYTITPNINNNNVAYVILRIKWPEGNDSGSYKIYSAEGKELTASIMPQDTKRIDVKIKDVNDNSIINTGSAMKPETEIKIPVYLDNSFIPTPVPGATPGNTPTPVNTLPFIKVKIWVGAYDTEIAGNLLIDTEKDITLQLGTNDIHLELGDYELGYFGLNRVNVA